MLQKVTPEQVGVSSAAVLDFLKALDSYNFCTHQILIARGDKIFAEINYAPFTADTKHRMYSISKSFIAAAVGFAIEDGIMALDDKLVDHFSEYVEGNEKITDHMRDTTLRDLITMRTSYNGAPLWIRGGVKHRPSHYFTGTATKVPGAIFQYDSFGSSMLSSIIERKTGKPFLEYLKEKCLLEMGFSPDAYCVQAPGGFSFSDSGVMCTPRDLLLFARLMMNKGAYDGKQYLDRAFCEAATSKQTDNDSVAKPFYSSFGYGYLIWKTPRDGFAFVGMGDQFAICDPKTDLVFIITSDNQGDSPSTRPLLYHLLYEKIITPLDFSAATLPANESSCAALDAYARDAKLFALGERTGTAVECPLTEEIGGKVYRLEANPMGIEWLRFDFDGKDGKFVFKNRQGERTLDFGLGYNKAGKFTETDCSNLVASVPEIGHSYDCVSSADFPEEKELRIYVQVIDMYFANAMMIFKFKGDEVAVYMTKTAEGFMNDYVGHAAGRLEK